MSKERYAVLFDMDGVIVNSNPAHIAAWQAFGRERLGVEITHEMFFRAISGRKNEEALASFPGRFSAEELTQVSADKEAFYRDRFGPQLQAVPGSLEFLAELATPAVQEEVAVALCTSAPPENAQFILDRFAIGSFFAAVVTSADVDKAKPDPTIYLLGAKAVGVAPARCVVIEDATAGVMAAKGAGMRCLALATSEPADHLYAVGADQVLPDLAGVTWSYLRSLLACSSC